MFLNCNRGFVFPDLILALSCLLLIFYLLLPFIIQVREHQNEIETFFIAEDILQSEIFRNFNFTDSVEYEINQSGKSFTFTSIIEEDKVLGCISWGNVDENKICKYRTKHPTR